MTTKKKTVTLEEAREQVSKVCHRLALLHLSFARTLVEEMGEEKGKQLVLKAIKDYGRRIGEGVKAKATAQGLDNNPANYKEDLPLYGMHERTETVEVDGEKRIRLYGCVMGNVWRELGAGKLGRLYCHVDPAKYMGFNPDFKLVHTKALPDGEEYCELVLRPTTEQERKDFADNDKDWSYLDR
ncbi:L-2-amino-thiazoline-4-carboxylic acid hydrolase [Chloroflexota bacterium]